MHPNVWRSVQPFPLFDALPENGPLDFPTALVLVLGQAHDEVLRRAVREIRTDLERLAGVDQVFTIGLHDPELVVEFEPRRLAARGLTAADLADSVGGWFRDTFAGKANAGEDAWLVRAIGQQADPDYLAHLTVGSVARPGERIPIAAAASVAAGLVRVQFFAFDPIRLFYVNLDMPAGAPIEATLARVERLERAVRARLKAGETRSVTSLAGIKFTDTEVLNGDTQGQVVVSLNPREKGMRDVSEIVGSMRKEIESLPGAGRVSFTMLSGGPPLTKPVRVRVRNDDYSELRPAADEIVKIVRAVPGTRDVLDDDEPGRPEFSLVLDREAVRSAGLSPAQVARIVRLHVDGEIVALMRDRGEKLEVRVRAEPRPSADIARLLDDPIALPSGNGAAVAGGNTTLRALTQASTGAGKGVIKHYNLRRAITVEADLDKQTTDTLAANARIKAEWDKVRTRYPRTDLDFSGELDDIEESLEAMKVLFALGVGLIYLILAAQFRSYWQPLMILVTVPLAFTGVVFGLLVSGNPLSLYTLYGVIALTGIAVNSAIVLIDAANARRRTPMSVLHAAVYAARRPVIPIIITSVTTIGGLFSLAFGLGGTSLIWGPVAASIVWGLGLSTILTLFVIPLGYWWLMPEHRLRRAG